MLLQISEESIDYYKVMGCENIGEVTEDELQRLELLEETVSYPPRFKIRFSCDETSVHYQNSHEVTITFNQVSPPLKNTFLLEGNDISLPISPLSSASSTNTGINSFNIG